jgi:hypothetical protein
MRNRSSSSDFQHRGLLGLARQELNMYGNEMDFGGG